MVSCGEISEIKTASMCVDYVGTVLGGHLGLKWSTSDV